MLTIQIGRAQNTYDSNYKESAAEYARYTQDNGQKITVAMVSDCIRGNYLGPEAAIAGAMQFLMENSGNDIPGLMYFAFDRAHRIMRRAAQSNGIQLAASLTIAMIVDNQRLYIGHLGHSRIYLYRPNKEKPIFEQLTLDHTYANIAILEGRLKPKEAIKHPDADTITRYIGTPMLIPPDMNIYADSLVDTIDDAESLGITGIELEPFDTILLTTDGMIKPGKTGRPVITVGELVKTISDDDAGRAAQEIVEDIYRHRPSDTVSIVLLKAMPEPKASLRLTLRAFVSILVMLAVLGFIIAITYINYVWT